MNRVKTELAVIGGGAAGLMCACTAAARGVDTVLLEPNRMLGRKLRITGKGRCNVTNSCDIKTFMAISPGTGASFTVLLTGFPPRRLWLSLKTMACPLRWNGAAGCFQCPTMQTMWQVF
mgnify:CR=1 FL=1